ncbi:B-cell receptor CD22-like [Hyla sarda]|uniref:B-cell receptor CD22-like n=1 Tax=Hyla sarda TaxID=327740 RepID=UPI0024C36C09|nr:B-cell receptor CD22-like [Hyla sarda]XP_056400848.1 B-cell receptor CD22-like [Hyla sarda]
MDAVKPVYLLLICQGFYLGSVGQYWTIPSTITALIGSCVEIPCTFHPDGTSGPSSTVWYSYYTGLQILEEYRARTSLIPGNNSCTLRIDPVRKEDGKEYYFPGIAEDKYINAYEKQSQSVYLLVTDKVNIQLHGSGTMTEGEASTIRCSADHTCGSSPPTIQWNKPGRVTEESVDITSGYWREESELTYIPSYVDDRRPLQCTATYPNGKKTERSITLNIYYPPKNVTVTAIGKDEVIEGSDVTLQCNSVSKPDVYKYEWYKGKKKTRLQYTGREITVRKVTGNMEPYSCAAINTVGRGESALMEIPVPYAAIGVHITVKNESKFTELTCDFLSSRPDVSHYTWMKDGSLLHNKTGKTLTVNVNEENNGQYSCIAHNTAGNSSSEVIHIKRESMDLPLILGSVAGVFFLLFFILVIFFCLRGKKKSAPPTSPIHGTLPAKISYDNMMTEEESEYGNIQSNHQTQPFSMTSGSSVDVEGEEHCGVYNNNDPEKPSEEVEYSVISHRRQDKEPLTSARAGHAEDVEYATLRR